MTRQQRTGWRPSWAWVTAGIIGAGLLFSAAAGAMRHALRAELSQERREFRAAHATDELVTTSGKVTNWWDPVPESVRARSVPTGPHSNITPADYAGAKSCAQCHEENYAAWSEHPHRWMNALADESTVVGDFSGDGGISYLGGEATFYTAGDKYLMRMSRDGTVRVFQINQTIGRRFFQYYVGKQIEGPAPSLQRRFYEYDHVLPFGYWIDEREWVPVVHVGDEVPDGERSDPFSERQHFADYATRCNLCHTTFPLGDELIRKGATLGTHAPMPLHFSALDYVSAVHPGVWKSGEPTDDVSPRDVKILSQILGGIEAPEHAINLGISCEGCHLGAKEHALGRQKRPVFFPQSPHLWVEAGGGGLDVGRTHDNVNWVCGRCHTGPRPQLTAGMSTWNSTEYADAMRGSCYSQLRCIDCHNPHEGIGKQWTRTPPQDDAVCLRCHTQYEPAEARVAHTHHPINSAGSHCMNCHMPRLNEGLQDVVRTHTIFSPSHRGMLEANEPNACNQCHVDKPIDWTLAHLKEWYGTTVSEEAIAAHYPHREQPAALGWLNSSHESVRLIAADSLTRESAAWALPDLLGALDDPFLLNRQFAQRGLEKMLDVDLRNSGYRFYQTPEERRDVLIRLRERLLNDDVSRPDASPQTDSPDAGTAP